MNEQIIEVNNLTFSYDKDKKILDDVSFYINKGEYVTLIGHNGSGKSTLAKLLSFLLEPESGEIYIDKEKLDEKSVGNIRNKIGIVFQNPDNQFIGATVEDDIAFGLENRMVETSKMHELVHEFASKVGMINELKKEPEELSGGQKQRVAIAGILALNLKIIIFDEATSMLDPEGVEEIRNLILKMKKEDKDLTFISITHDVEECFLSDRVIILNEGKIFKNDSPFKVFENEEDIKNIGLDIPFIMKLKKALKKENVEIDKDFNSLEELAKYICQK